MVQLVPYLVAGPITLACWFLMAIFDPRLFPYSWVVLPLVSGVSLYVAALSFLPRTVTLTPFEQLVEDLEDRTEPGYDTTFAAKQIEKIRGMSKRMRTAAMELPYSARMPVLRLCGHLDTIIHDIIERPCSVGDTAVLVERASFASHIVEKIGETIATDPAQMGKFVETMETVASAFETLRQEGIAARVDQLDTQMRVIRKQY